MARVAKIVKDGRRPKYETRKHNRCLLCGRARAYMRLFGVCRLCFRELAHRGELPGVTKASW